MAGTWHELENQCQSVDVAESTSYEMTRLDGNTYYRIELRAHNIIGFSSPASVIMKTTRGESDHANNNLGTFLYTAGLNSAASPSIHKTLFTRITSTTTTAATIATTSTVMAALATTTCITLLSILATILV